MGAESRPHWQSFHKLREGSQELLADAGRRFHGLWYLRDGEGGIQVSRSGDEKVISMDLTPEEVDAAPQDIRGIFLSLGLLRRGAVRVAVALKEARHLADRSNSYGFRLKICPIEENAPEVEREGISAVVGLAAGKVERVLTLNKIRSLVGVAANVGENLTCRPRLLDTDPRLGAILESSASWVVGLVEKRLHGPKIG